MLSVSTQNYKKLLLIARQSLADVLEKTPSDFAAYSKGKAVKEEAADVHVCIWRKGKLRAHGTSHYFPLEDGIYMATVFALEVPVDDTLILVGELEELTVEILIKTGETLFNLSSDSDSKDHLNAFSQGISLKFNDAFFDLLPTTIITEKLFSLDEQLDYLLNLCAQERDILSDKETQIFITDWLHISETKGFSDEVTLFRRRRSQKRFPVSYKSISAAAVACGNRLVNQQSVRGIYTYEYNALENRISNENFNIVRMAGTAFSMSMLADFINLNDSKRHFENSADSAIRYLFTLSSTTPFIKESLYIAQEEYGRYNFVGKLGSTALALLGLQFGTFYEKYADQRQKLTNTILGMQNQDGSYNSYVPTKVFPVSPNRKASANYFPGEALVAFCYALKNNFDRNVARSVAKSFHFYKKHFTDEPNTAFVLWQASAWAIFYRLMTESAEIKKIADECEFESSDVAAFVYQQADWILQFQHNSATTDIEDYIGGFPNDTAPNSVSSCYLEAVIRAAGLAFDRGDEEKFGKYKDASTKGLEFLLRLQLKEEEDFLFPEPKMAIGGISSNLVSFKLRNDRDQHAITAFIAALETPSIFGDSEKDHK